MKKLLASIGIVLLIVALVVPGVIMASPAATASRDLPATAVEPGAEFDVGITASDYGMMGQVVETLPSGFSYVSSTLDASQVNVAGSLVSFILIGETSFTYSVTAATVEDTYLFSGIIKDSDLNEFTVLDDTEITVVADIGPVAGFTADPTSGPYPLEVTFTDTSTSHDGIILWEWDFSYDGTNFNVESSIQHPVYTYQTEGTHTVALRVTEADADSDMMVAENLITVTAPGDVTPPVIEYANAYYYVGTESARPGDLFEVSAVVTDDTAVTVVVETPFGTFPLVGEEYEGIAVYWVFNEVPEDTPPGTYELTLIAEDEAGNTATQSLELEVVLSLTTYNVWLADGWNLISLPLIPDATDTETVLDGLSFPGEDMVRAVWGEEIADGMMPDIDTVWYYDAAGEYGTTGEWLFFDPDAPEVGDLTEMEDGKGYWVDVVISPMDEEASRGALIVYGVELVSGPTLPPAYAVVEGWNLIGFKETRDMHFSQYLSAVEGKYARIYAYDANGQRFYIVGEGGPENMLPGLGYWIYILVAGYIVP